MVFDLRVRRGEEPEGLARPGVPKKIRDQQIGAGLQEHDFVAADPPAAKPVLHLRGGGESREDHKVIALGVADGVVHLLRGDGAVARADADREPPAVSKNALAVKRVSSCER